MPQERDYSHRSVVEKLGIKPGHAVAIDETHGRCDPALIEQVIAQAGRPIVAGGCPIDVALIVAGDGVNLAESLAWWRARIVSTGGIWLLTPKRGQVGYRSQMDLIDAGKAARLVDNKSCSVSNATGAMRFVIRREDRAAHQPLDW